MNQSQVQGLAAGTEQGTGSKTTSFAPLLHDELSGTSGTAKGSKAVALSASRVVSATKPTILFCDLRLLPGESKSFWYREILPLEGPPSFRGQILRYAYKLTIGTQRIHSHIRLLHVPIKVLVLQEFSDAVTLNGSEELTPANPFLSGQQKESHSDSAFQILQVVTSQRNQKFYNVTNQRGHVVKFCVFKQAYKLGEDIVGSLDFSESNVPCIQYAVSLQSVEELTPEYRTEKQRNCISTYSKFHEMVIGYQQQHFVLPVPLHVTPSFHTELINLKWKLHFEFVISTASVAELGVVPSQPPDPETMNGKYWQAPHSVNIETMVWDLPVKLYPNLPAYLSQGLQMQMQHKQRI